MTPGYLHKCAKHRAREAERSWPTTYLVTRWHEWMKEPEEQSRYANVGVTLPTLLTPRSESASETKHAGDGQI